MLRKVTWIFSLMVILAALLGLAGGLVLAAFQPYRPGDGLRFTAQAWVEQTVADLDLRPGGRALRLLQISARRSQDLRALAGSPQEGAALRELQTSLTQAVHAVAISPQNQVGVLRPALIRTLLSTETALDQANLSAGAAGALTQFHSWEGEVAQ
jgi:hypothetical protein